MKIFPAPYWRPWLRNPVSSCSSFLQWLCSDRSGAPAPFMPSYRTPLLVPTWSSPCLNLIKPACVHASINRDFVSLLLSRDVYHMLLMSMPKFSRYKLLTKYFYYYIISLYDFTFFCLLPPAFCLLPAACCPQATAIIFLCRPTLTYIFLQLYISIFDYICFWVDMTWKLFQLFTLARSVNYAIHFWTFLV